MTEPTILHPQTMLAPQSEATALLHMIERVARDPSIDMNRLEPLLDRRDRVLASERQQAFDDAMALAQQEMRSVATDSANPQTRSRYASYHAVDKVLRPIYTKHGFSLSFGTAEGAPDDHVRITCRVSRSGHREHYQIDMPCDGAGAKGAPVMTRTHAMGSASTYGRRYLLLMIFNVSIGEPDDDDGNAAGKVDVVSDEQALRIANLVAETKSNITLFLKYLGVPSIADIPAKEFDRIVALLERKRGAP